MKKACYPTFYKAVDKKNEQVIIPPKRIERTANLTLLGTGYFGDVILAKKVINDREDGKEYAIKTERGPNYEFTERHNIRTFIRKAISEVEKATIASKHNIGPKIYESHFCKQEGKITSIIIMEKWDMSLKDFFVKRFARNLAYLWDKFKLKKKDMIINHFSHELLKNHDLPTRRQNIYKIIFRCSNRDTDINVVYSEIQSLIKNALDLPYEILETLLNKVEKMRTLELFHGDILPKNILVNVDLSTMTITDICISDFGLYKIIDKDNYEYLLKSINSWFGSKVEGELRRKVKYESKYNYNVKDDKFLLDTLFLKAYGMKTSF